MTKTLSQPYSRFHEGEKDQLKFSDSKHTPFNKRPGSVDNSRCELVVTRCPGGDWVNFSVEETTTVNGRTQSRTISTSMPFEYATRFAKFITEGV